MKYVVAVYYEKENKEGLFCDLIPANSKHEALVFAFENMGGFFSSKQFKKLYWHINEIGEDE